MKKIILFLLAVSLFVVPDKSDAWPVWGSPEVEINLTVDNSTHIKNNLYVDNSTSLNKVYASEIIDYGLMLSGNYAVFSEKIDASNWSSLLATVTDMGGFFRVEQGVALEVVTADTDIPNTAGKSLTLRVKCKTSSEGIKQATSISMFGPGAVELGFYSDYLPGDRWSILYVDTDTVGEGNILAAINNVGIEDNQNYPPTPTEPISGYSVDIQSISILPPINISGKSYGDSTTRGAYLSDDSGATYEVPCSSQSYTALLANRYNIKLINMGVDGDTLTDIREDVLADLSENVDYMLLTLSGGTNNIIDLVGDYDPNPVTGWVSLMNDMISAAKLRARIVIVSTIPISPWYYEPLFQRPDSSYWALEYIDEYKNSLVQEYVDDPQVIVINMGGVLNTTTHYGDLTANVHPVMSGHVEWANAIDNATEFPQYLETYHYKKTEDLGTVGYIQKRPQTAYIDWTKYKTITGSYNVKGNSIDVDILLDGSDGYVRAILNTSPEDGEYHNFKCINANNPCRVVGSGNLIDSADNATLSINNNITLKFMNGAWRVL